MATTGHSADLQSLPIEILGSIIRLVDPIGVMSLSQVNCRFRAVVNPGRDELGERLLQLECLPEFGGKVHLPGPRSGPKYGTRPSPSPDVDLDGMRWACLGCMRLLSHIHFDNHSLLKLKFRKPIPGTYVADNPITSWDMPRHLARRKGPRTEYIRLGRYMTRNGTEGPNVDRLNLSLKVIAQPGLKTKYVRKIDLERRESVRWGVMRHLRRCNECRYQMGHIGRQPNILTGAITIPIQMSRRVQFTDAVERYFPGFLDTIDKKRPLPEPPGLVWSNPRRTFYNWTMCMLRCPGCETWQEWRAFFFANGVGSMPGMDYPLNLPDLAQARLPIDLARCNHCTAAQEGRDILGHRLTAGIRIYIIQKIINIVQKLERGFFLLRLVLNNGEPYRVISEEDRDELNRHFARTIRGVSDSLLHDLERIQFLGQEYTQVKELFYRLLAEYGLEEELKSFSMWTELELWLEHYSDFEKHYYWFKDILDGDVLKADSLVDWALARDGSSLI